MSELESGFRISDLVQLVLRRRAVMAIGLLVGLVLGYVAFASSPTKFSATSRVQVRPVTQDPFDPKSSDTQVIDVATEQDLVKSDAVAAQVRRELGLELTTRDLMRPVTVSSKPDSLVLEITYVSGDAETARDRANAIAQGYLTQRSDEATFLKASNLGRIDEQITEARTALKAAQTSGDQGAVEEAQGTLSSLTAARVNYLSTDTEAVGRLVRKAALPTESLSKLALGKGVGVLGLWLAVALALSIYLDRTDSRGGGRRAVRRAFPDATLRVFPKADGQDTAAEVAAATDRFAVEMAGSAHRGKASSVLLVATNAEPPVKLAEDLSASLAYAGIPTLFVLAGTSTREVSQARVVTSFTDLLESPTLAPNRALPADAGAEHGAAHEGDATTVQAPLVAWLRPRGSAESSGLLRQNVVRALIAQASREGYEIVVFVAGSPTHNASASALSQWVAKTAVVVTDEESRAVERTVEALQESGATVTEVVWT